MGAYLDEYGTLIVEVITGIIVIGLMYMALAAGSLALDTEFFDEGIHEKNLESHISLQSGPELRVYEELSIPVDEELDMNELIISAFGGADYELHYLTAEESSSRSMIKKNLVAGAVNIVGADAIERTPGSYHIRLYAKSGEGFGTWTEAEAMITYFDPEEE